jgi:hypothetical protein
MGFFDSVQTIIQTALEQFIPSGGTTIHFTNNFQQQARGKGLTEKDAIDVYYHGQEVKPNMLVQKYNGYEIGIYYFKDKRTGQPLISSIWKRARCSLLGMF